MGDVTRVEPARLRDYGNRAQARGEVVDATRLDTAVATADFELIFGSVGREFADTATRVIDGHRRETQVVAAGHRSDGDGARTAANLLSATDTTNSREVTRV